MDTALLAGLTVAGVAAAYVGRRGIRAWRIIIAEAKAEAGAKSAAREKEKYEGGFKSNMTRKEAALILGIRENDPIEKVKLAHRTHIVKNHPDTGGSAYIASKINQAKEMLMKKNKSTDSAQ